mgnify:CR=1 FL=1
MEIQLKKNSTTPLYKQIRNTIRSQILSGQLSDGFKLPSERQLVEKLGVHRNMRCSFMRDWSMPPSRHPGDIL